MSPLLHSAALLTCSSSSSQKLSAIEIHGTNLALLPIFHFTNRAQISSCNFISYNDDAEMEQKENPFPSNRASLPSLHPLLNPTQRTQHSTNSRKSQPHRTCFSHLRQTQPTQLPKWSSRYILASLMRCRLLMLSSFSWVSLVSPIGSVNLLFLQCCLGFS